jgi:hypothetical protein
MENDWGRAFAKQSRADFDSWKSLNASSAPRFPYCHKLHFLQMACEKICKAYLFRSGSAIENLISSHAYTAKNLLLILRNQVERKTNRPLSKYSRKFHEIKLLAREIELLSPAVDDHHKRPDNCEYPWELSSGVIRIPCEYEFPNLSSLNDNPGGRELLKLIEISIQEFLGNS